MPKRLDPCVQEFAGRHNVRDADTIDRMQSLVSDMVGNRLRCSELTADNGMSREPRA